ncbi:MAG: hypothetical protein OHK0024_03160 [Thalassobaculales bacterium]
MAMLKALVADEEPGVHRLLSAHLTHARLEVVSAYSAEAALSEASDGGFDVAILDLGLAQIQDEVGNDLIRRLRMVMDEETPIIVLTRDARIASVRGALLGGADDYVLKPVNGSAVGALCLRLISLAARKGLAARRERYVAELERRMGS